jgi:hypothetical protein
MTKSKHAAISFTFLLTTDEVTDNPQALSSFPQYGDSKTRIMFVEVMAFDVLLCNVCFYRWP